MTDALQIIEHSSCSTHIHIGYSGGWSLYDLKQLAKGWLWLERKIVEALPEHRQNCIWGVPNHLCRSNDESSKLCDLYAEAIETNNFASLFSFVDEANSIEELMIRAAPERLLAWSLKSTSTCGTVEFRRPPQSLSAEDTIHWVEMTIEIVVWALAADFKDELTLNAPAILTSI